MFLDSEKDIWVKKINHTKNCNLRLKTKEIHLSNNFKSYEVLWTFFEERRDYGV